MGLEHIHPEGLVNLRSFTQVVAATGAKTIYISGQVAWDVDGGIVGEGDFAAQAQKAYENLGGGDRGCGRDAGGCGEDQRVHRQLRPLDGSGVE